MSSFRTLTRINILAFSLRGSVIYLSNLEGWSLWKLRFASRVCNCRGLDFKTGSKNMHATEIYLNQTEFNYTSYICHGFVSAGDALGRERPATPMSSFLAGRSGCK